MPTSSTSDVRGRQHAERDGQTVRLLARAQAHPDPEAAAGLRRQAVLANRSLAVGLARQFRNRGVDEDDLVGVALLALVGAVRRYRPARGSGFAAFAVPTVIGELKRHFRDHGWAVRPPRSLQELHHEVLQTDAVLEQTLERTPTDADVAYRLSISVAEVRRARVVESHYRAASLDAPVNSDSSPSSATLLDLMPDDGDDPYETVVSLLALRTALAGLDDHDRELLDLRFGLELTQRQIGHRIGVSQMQVSRLLSAVLSRLRTDIESERPRADRVRPVDGRVDAA